MSRWPAETREFELLAPLIVTRDPVRVRSMLIQLESGELTLKEARDRLATMKPHPLLVRGVKRAIDA